METEKDLKDKFIDLLPYSSNMNLIAEKCVNICKEHNNKLKQEHAEMHKMLLLANNTLRDIFNFDTSMIEQLLNKIKENGN
jgi:hypothetical protein